ncbi:hypothetical protein DESC_830033 [Desulfosarcina cetonica]|nr:hypothetical protein DESC_830033 [Desulfosarcina cetonica]
MRSGVVGHAHRPDRRGQGQQTGGPGPLCLSGQQHADARNGDSRAPEGSPVAQVEG